MSQENVEVVMAFFEAYNGGDIDAVMSFFAPDVQAFPDASVFPEADPLHGREDLKRWFEETAWAWVNPQAVVREVIVTEDGRVLARFDWGGEGVASGIQTMSSFTGVHTVRDGRISRVEWYSDHDKALAVGLEE